MRHSVKIFGFAAVAALCAACALKKQRANNGGDVLVYNGANVDEEILKSDPDNIAARVGWSTVALGEFDDNGKWVTRCSGIAVGPRAILSVAHCGGSPYVMFGANPTELLAKYGKRVHRSYLYKVTNGFIPSGWKEIVSTPAYDLSLIVLERDLVTTMSPFIRPARLAPEGVDWITEVKNDGNSGMEIAGYGGNVKVNVSQEGMGQLRYGTLGKACKKMRTESFSFCNETLSTARSGDSGGPVFFRSSAYEESDNILAGLIRGAGSDQKGVIFVDLTLPWVRAELRKLAEKAKGVKIEGL